MDPSTGASIPARPRARRRDAAKPVRTPPARPAVATPVVAPARPTPFVADALPIPNPPSFADRTFDVAAFGADVTADNTEAFARAIAACAEAGGGRVLVPAGEWLVGPIRLLDGVELHLAAGARLRFVDDLVRYLPAVELFRAGHAYRGLAPMIYANGVARVGLTGGGTIVGGGAAWWPRAKGEPALAAALVRMARDGTPTAGRRFDDPEAGFRPPLVAFVNCRDVLVDGLAIDGAGPGCAIRLARCDRATVRGLRVRAADGPDNDGVAIEASRDVRVTRCDIETACHAVRISGDAEGGRCERVSVGDVRLRSERGDGVTVGPADVRDVRVNGVHVEAARHGISLRGTRGRNGGEAGAAIERVAVEGLTIDHARGAAIFVGPDATPGAAGANGVAYGADDRWPTFRHLGFRRVACARAAQAVVVAGLPDQCVEDLTVHDIDVRADDGLSCASAQRVWLRDVRVTPAMGPDLSLRDVRDVWIDGIRHDRPSATFLELRGRRTARVHLASARDARVRPAIVLGVDVPRDALVQD